MPQKPFHMGDNIVREKSQLGLHSDFETEFVLSKKTLEALENETLNLHKSNG